MKNHADEHEAFAASRSSEHVYVPIDDRNFTTLDKHAETIEMDAKLPLVSTLEHATAVVLVVQATVNVSFRAVLQCLFAREGTLCHTARTLWVLLQLIRPRRCLAGPRRRARNRQERVAVQLGEASCRNKAPG